MGHTMYCVYILENLAGKFYIGQTDDLERRVSEHNDPSRSKSKYTSKNGPWKLVCSEPFGTRSEAVKRERFMKSRKSAKWIMAYLIDRASPDVYRD